VSMEVPRRPQITLAHVAARAEVDRSVVSRVLTGDPRLNVRPETRQRVLDAVAALDYRPNLIARSLRTQRADTFGLVIPDFMNPIYASIITGAEVAAAARGCVLLTGSLTNGEVAIDQYLDLLGRGRVDGLLLAGAEATGALVDRLEHLDLPWMLINRRAPKARRYVVLDDERAAQMAVEHLHELGHRRIAHLAGPQGADTARRREAGYRKALRRLKLPARGELVVRGDYSNAGGAEAMRSLVAMEPRPTAVFVANVAAAIGALAAAREAGVAVPQEISVIAVHDLALAAYLSPPLTTLRMPLEEMGRRAIELLATRPATEHIEEVVEGPIELVVRGSTAPPPV
jgi:LacI family transcriptional regulator